MGNLLEMRYKDPMRKLDLSGRMEIKSLANKAAELYIYGDIVSSQWMKWSEEDKTPQDIVDFLKEIEGAQALNIFVNSGGGEVFAGIAMYNILKRNQAHKIVHVDGLAASIATMPMFAGDEIIVPTNAEVMVHKPWTIAIGNANDFVKLAKDLDVAEESILNVYKEHLAEGVDIETVRQLVQDESWMTGEKAAEYFNIKTEESAQIAACASGFFGMYRKTPQAFIKPPDPPAPPPEPNNEAEKQRFLFELDL